MVNEMMVRAEDVSYAYEPREGEQDAKSAVDGVTLSVKRGEFCAVLGRNGSGKSTLAKLINALLVPKSGKIFVNGLDAAVPENVWEVRKSAGMIFQNPDNQIVAAVIEEDVAFGPENIGVPSEEIVKRVQESLAAVGMTEYAARPPHALSGGQKQRVAIAGVLAMKPLCLIMDEPTAMLDPSGRKEVLNTARRLNRDEGICIILITHYMDEAAAADRVIVMDGGKIVMDGAPKAVFARAAELKALGLDVPQAAEIALKLREKGLPLPDNILTADELAAALKGLKGK